MTKRTKIGCVIAFVIVALFTLSIYGWLKGTYNKMVELDETVKKSWSQVENVYQRRMDLIPNLVNTVKGYAAHEQETFTMVTEARAKAGGMVNITGDVLTDPALFQKYQQAQSGLASALQRLMVIQERYPDLKANQGFRDLQSQLEGTENRISVERRRFNETAQVYNIYIKKFPTNLLANIFNFKEKLYFSSVEGADVVPEVKF
ncbi:MAG: LemA family protein [Candidatus Cloacimonetes bacterium]|nr:LemA family protein [Candidatus Cloacimonadota bacterium]